MLQDEIHVQWEEMKVKIESRIGKRPTDLNAVLYLIGIQELGKVKRFEKEEKQDLINLGLTTILSLGGYFKFSHRDEEGWPHYEQQKLLDKLDLKNQVRLIKSLCVRYFESV